MPFKDLLIVVGNDTAASDRYALEFARICGAALTATASRVVPTLPAVIRAEMPGDILDRMREEAETTARTALDAFSDRAKQVGVPVETVMPDFTAGDIGSAITRLARYFDATLLPHPEPGGADTSALIEAVLFGSGRPVLIVPSPQGPAQVRTILVAWDEGRPAARAVADALPLLMMGRRVEVVTVGHVGEDRNWRSSNLVRHLARHGIEAHFISLVSTEANVASILLSHATDVNADLIVMGGYGHSRLREMVLGGTTRSILQTMTVPVLMAH